MNRRNVLLGLGTAAAGSGIVFGSGAFTQVQAERDITIGVSTDENALVELKPNDSIESVFQSDSGELAVDTGKLSDEKRGLNVGSTVQIGATTESFGDEVDVADPAFEIINRFDDSPDATDFGTIDIGVDLTAIIPDEEDQIESLEFIATRSESDDGDSLSSEVIQAGDRKVLSGLEPASSDADDDRVAVAIRVETSNTDGTFSIDDAIAIQAGSDLTADNFPNEQAAPANTIENQQTGSTFSTIQNAVNDASPGDTLIVGPGTFDESVEITSDGISLRGTGDDTTIVGNGVSTGSRPHAAIHINDGSNPVRNVTIEGFTIRNPDGKYGIFAGTGSTNKSPDGISGLVIRNNDIEDISTNKTGSALTGGPAGIGIRGDYGTDGNPGIEIRNNTIDTVENTSGAEPTGITLKSFDGDAGFGFDSNGNLTSDPSSPPATDTDIINNDIRNITSNGGFATKGISVSGEFRDVDIIGNALDTIESPGGDARAITLSENSNNGGPFNFDIDDDGSGERLGPQDFTIENNEISNVNADDPRSVNVGGYETLGSNSVSGNIINSGAVTRFAGDQDGFQPGDEDTLNVTGNTFTDATADTYISLSNKSDLDAVFSDNTFQFSPNPVVNGSRIVSTGVRFNNQTFSGSTNQVTIERVAAADTSDFVLVTHRSSPGDNGNDIVDEVSEIGNKIGSSAVLTGTAEDVTVDLTKNLDEEDTTEVTQTQTLITMLHVADDTGGTNFGDPITRNGAPVFDQAEITIN